MFLCTAACGFVGDSRDASEEVHPAVAEKRARQLSSGLFDLTALRGKALGGGPGISAGEESQDYSVQHFWSISGAPPDELTQGFERLREDLPGAGWRITRYGRANSQAGQMEIEALHEKDGYSVSVELLIRSTRKGRHPGASKDDMIHFSVASPEYRAPEGVDPDDY
ncbi:hypothetical protein IHE55_19420 [Streptomyces pactum]|uniref:Lipoprotein n=1 Tax=Streptomyces pactum TaxID=68249 RepID=A0ABS0NNP1_9ACTN|nr:hypothetical protein [Streptomyces pactum]MBH5336821.1 hypothetical protein [Streptomyces pactum]